ncbi:hypothetical protein FGG24_gp68 [Mycobacterium phage JC27]|uniref:Uncharacterized protein n=2 Tax=Viruses TaxID=10239 RepID=G1D3B7_9CAUD|nr:hypothetical protein FGG24_gp68 [Mycobacterium phage JC27]AEK09263.1 hypothetical protein PBI_JC27_68 [Mycobacterium phage JC27]
MEHKHRVSVDGLYDLVMALQLSSPRDEEEE